VSVALHPEVRTHRVSAARRSPLLQDVCTFRRTVASFIRLGDVIFTSVSTSQWDIISGDSACARSRNRFSRYDVAVIDSRTQERSPGVGGGAGAGSRTTTLRRRQVSGWPPLGWLFDAQSFLKIYLLKKSFIHFSALHSG